MYTTSPQEPYVQTWVYFRIDNFKLARHSNFNRNTSGKDHTPGLLHDILPGYTISNKPRHSRGGGLAIPSRSDLTSKKNKGPSYKSFDYLDFTLTSGNMLLRVISIYRPPISAKNKLSFCQFLSEFSDFLE